MYDIFTCVHDLSDCQEILKLVLSGQLPFTQNRLTSRDRKRIVAGMIFIYNENMSGISRWTDSKKWGASRVKGCFTVYQQQNGKLIKKVYFKYTPLGRINIIIYSDISVERNHACCHKAFLMHSEKAVVESRYKVVYEKDSNAILLMRKKPEITNFNTEKKLSNLFRETPLFNQSLKEKTYEDSVHFSSLTDTQEYWSSLANLPKLSFPISLEESQVNKKLNRSKSSKRNKSFSYSSESDKST